MVEYEDPENPMLTLAFKEKKGKNLAITCIYRQWKAPGEINPNNAAGIARQVRRFKLMTENLDKIAADNYDMIVGGDINIDRHPPNDPLSSRAQYGTFLRGCKRNKGTCIVFLSNSEKLPVNSRLNIFYILNRF